jgi:Protein of unknown function (DUF1553)/Protein of unknown function (DUF1549)/Planctomycete cytochrome C
MRPIAIAGCVMGCALCLPGIPGRAGEEPVRVDFNRDIRPILSGSCYQCHGPDRNKRKADLRLDTRDGLFRSSPDSTIVVVGKPDQSELLARVTASEDDIRMPPPKGGTPLTPGQIALVTRWIEQGAEWKGHWAYLANSRPGVPGTSIDRSDSDAIDRFIRERLAAEGLAPSPEADRVTLIRRLSFDLVGLPPSPSEVNAFVTDAHTDAYERVVDRLLGSPHFGERMAMFWLDLVRYADTTGYHGDNHVDLYLYRDYVIRSFNSDKAFDRFTIEQIAGDLIEGATEETRIASGYNRALQTTQEGGAQAKEYLAKYSADRVRNVSTVWLGATLGCAECHDHKFDPFSTGDFYSLAAFFADIKETAVGVQEPTPFPTPAQAESLRRIEEQIARVKSSKAPSSNQRQELADLEKRQAALKRQIPTSLVSTSVPPRVIRILPRGNWLDENGPIVEPRVPASLGSLSVKGRRPSRVDLAVWLVGKDNPLVARVVVNRLWKLVFGQGLVTTSDDLGSQGASPSHPELLDWLASQFVDSGWKVKPMLKRLVMSEAYRQSSDASPVVLSRDPGNRWLSRQNRFRLDAEAVRDNALAISGLLSQEIGGPSVKPYQPPGYWIFLNFPKREYEPDKGENQYRRGLYTYWQRTFLHPSLLAFDATTREECVDQRARSNTPVQSLVLLNDRTYVEAARAFATRLFVDGGSDPAVRIENAFRLAVARRPRPEEFAVLLKLVRKHTDQYKFDPGAARAVLAIGDSPTPSSVDPAELAAWTSLARVLLNLHETITRN